MTTPHSTPISLRRQRTELALSFDLPTGPAEGLCEIQCHLRVNGSSCPPYGSGIFVLADMWSTARQQLTGHPDEALLVNRALSDIRAQHRALVQDLICADIEPSASQLQHYWFTGQAVSPRLLHVYEEHLMHLQRVPLAERKTKSTLHKWYLAHQHLRDYLNYTLRPDLTLSEVTVGWAKAYYQWLRERPMSIDTAARYTCFIREVLQHGVDHDLIAHNKLHSLSITREAAKTVVCLTPAQIQQMESLELSPRLDQVRRWALLCCYTGLDYTDAVALARNPSPHIQRLPYGEKIVWRRLKFQQVKGAFPEWGVCHIPLLPETKRLLLQVPEWEILSSQRVNQNLRKIEKLLDLPFRLTTKVCRKTAGALFLVRGYQAEAVRKIMGLKTLTVFERNYMLLLGELVDNNMELLSQKRPAASEEEK